MICDYGDVVVVPFPFIDRPIVKRRPALVLSNRAFNADHGSTVCLMITTGAGSAWPSDIEIGDRSGTGLAHRSLIRWKLVTLPNQSILAHIGALAAKDRGAVTKSARTFLASA